MVRVEHSPPPLRGFNSAGEPVDVASDEPAANTGDVELIAPAVSDSVDNYRLRSRTVRPPPVYALGETQSQQIVVRSRLQTGAECELRLNALGD